MGIGDSTLRVLVVGNGGSEHALAWAVARSPRVSAVAVAPVNGGTALFAENIPVSATDVEGLVRAAREWRADFVVTGPDASLAAGSADGLRDAGFLVFGNSKAAAR